LAPFQSTRSKGLGGAVRTTATPIEQPNISAQAKRRTTVANSDLHKAIADAVAAGDQHQEATARVNLAAILLSNDDPQALTAFEEALALVRRMQDQRRELILYLNFTPHLLARGDTARATKLAQRAAELAERGSIRYRAIAALNLAQVWQEGHGEARKAFAYQGQAAQLLKTLREQDPSAAKELLAMAGVALAKAAQNAMQLGLVDEAAEIVTLLDPERGAELERLKSQKQPSGEAPDIAALQRVSHPDLAPILAAWRAAGAGRPSPGVAHD